MVHLHLGIPLLASVYFFCTTQKLPFWVKNCHKKRVGMLSRKFDLQHVNPKEDQFGGGSIFIWHLKVTLLQYRICQTVLSPK